MKVIYRKRQYEVIGKIVPLPFVGGVEWYILKGKKKNFKVRADKIDKNKKGIEK